MTTPFTCSYTVTEFHPAYRPFEPRSPRELLVRSIISSAGAAAAITLERLWPNPAAGRRALRSLSRAGCLTRHKLLGERALNVYALTGDADPNLLVRACAVAQCYLRLREHVPCYLIPLTGRWLLNFRGRPKQVLVLRRGDSPEVFIPLLRHPSILVCETRDGLQSLAGLPVRVVVDEDLLFGPLRFYFPTGEEEVNFPYTKLNNL